MSDISLEIQLCRTNTTYDSIQTCLDIMKKDYDNTIDMYEWFFGAMIAVLICYVIYLWRKKS